MPTCQIGALSDTTDHTALADRIAAVIEDAAVHGLCHEGQAELALGELRRLRPDWPAARCATFVEELMHGD